ncbi:dsDNA nuclease domain-containing protein [Pseudorhodoferax sp. Leaf265]|uniref:CD-NTase-associated endodeoxyribonuclease Cap4 n=1 Tax=Pseudorhodoferax sp. Leaf265 TaxID=1736315 RepID=UPI0006F4C96E|nr:dsDNA nuclease domain-containing protein [Pseudorhodoferax sp. Leaf265]KQP15555.1 hypothetical protein ASF45_28580 [Pseudorhodoferax sp. Leaf265]
MSVGLLEKESTGGATARVGFEYQDAYVLQNLPKWLSQSAFSHVVSEAIGDVEVCYHGSGGRVVHLMLEAKNHELSSTAFWAEVARFKSVHEAAPQELVRFGLVCLGYNGKTSPFVSMLGRLRGVGMSYQPDSVILQRDRDEVMAWAAKQGVDEDFAGFALQHVDFETYSPESADAAFAGEVERHLRTIDLGGRQAARLRDRFKAHIARSSTAPVHRCQLELDICEVLEHDRGDWLSSPTRVRLVGSETSLDQLTVAADEFIGPARISKTTADWQQLSASAREVAVFLSNCTERRSVVLDGRQGMSAACLLGHAFRATNKFVLHVEHNGLLYRTDVYDQANGPFFQESTRDAPSTSAEGVASISFTTAVGADLTVRVGAALQDLPVLTLCSGRAISGQSEMNLAVNEAKAALVKFRSEKRLDVIHLFLKGPSAFSMLLGHRLNAVCKVQLYDWVDGAYRATAMLDG